MASVIRTTPEPAMPDSVVTVAWELGEDTTWCPQPDDEIRLVTTSGVLAARALLRDATTRHTLYVPTPAEAARAALQPVTRRPVKPDGYEADASLRCASVLLACPPHPGGYVLCLCEGASLRRVISTPFRVVGSTLSARAAISVTADDAGKLDPLGETRSEYRRPLPAGEAVEVYANGRLRVTFSQRDVLPSHTLVVVEASLGENTGWSVKGQGPFGHCAAVYEVPSSRNDGGELGADDSHTMIIVAPSAAGRYEVRLMTPARNGIPYATHVSNTFFVRQSPTKNLDSTTVIEGTIRTSVRECLVGQTIRVSFDITSDCGALLSPLDSVVAYLYGRAESIVHHGGLTTCVGERTFRRTMDIRAPTVDGFYEVAYFPFGEQRPVIISEPLTVVAPYVSLSVNSGTRVLKHEKSAAIGRTDHVLHINGTLVLDFAIDARVSSPDDRIVVIDDLANVVYCSRIDPQRRNSIMPPPTESSNANSDLRPSSSSLTSNSTSVELEEATSRGQTVALLQIPGKFTVHYYSCVLQRLMCRLPEFIVVHPPGDVSFPTAQLLALAVVPELRPISFRFWKEGRDTRHTRERLHDCVALFRADDGDTRLTHWRDDPRALPALQLHYLRGAVEDRGEFSGTVPCGKYCLRYLVLSSGHFHRICTSECFFEVKPRDDPALRDFHEQPLIHASLPDLATTRHRLTNVDGAPTLTASSLESRAAAGVPAAHRLGQTLGTNSAKALAKAKLFTAVLEFRDDTEYAGAVIEPRGCTTDRPVVVTYHLTGGAPRVDDKIVIIADDRTRIAAELSVSLGETSKDMSIGTMRLNAPQIPGRYMAGYFSDKYKTFVLLSPVFRIVADATQTVAAGALTTVAPAALSSSLGTAADRAMADASAALSDARALLSSQSHLARNASTTLSLSGPAAAASMVMHRASVGSSFVGSQRPGLAGSPTSVSGSFSVFARSKSVSMNHIKPGNRGRVRALVVCVAHLKSQNELKGPINDASRIVQTLQRCFECNDIRLLCELRDLSDRPPTADNIRQGIAWLVAGARPEDQLFFFFSGSGSTFGGEKVLLPTDYDWGPRLITFTELATTLFARVPSGAALAVILDASFQSNQHDACGQLGIWREETALGSVFGRNSETVPHRGMAATWRRREVAAAASAGSAAHKTHARTPWRCIVPPNAPPLPDVDSSSPPALLSTPNARTTNIVPLPVTQPYGSSSKARAKGEAAGPVLDVAAELPVLGIAGSALFVVYEASRYEPENPQGAWDVFLPSDGCSVGLFTHTLCSTLLETADSSRLAHTFTWAELHERVCSRIFRYPFFSHPRLLVNHIAVLDAPVCFNMLTAGQSE